MATDLTPPPAPPDTTHRRSAVDNSVTGLDGLVERLRQHGFRAGPGEAVNAARLLVRLGQTADPPQRVAALLPWLRPVFCSTREEQARFGAVFGAWADSVEQEHARRDAAAAASAGGRTEPPPPAPARPVWWRQRATRWLLIGGIAVAVGIWVRQRPPETPPAPAPPVGVAPSGAPAPAPAQGGIAPSALPGPPAAGPAATGYHAATRDTRSLQPLTYWGLALLPLLGLLVSGALPGLSLLQGSRRSGRQVRLDSSRLQGAAQRLLPPMASDVAGRLERHVRKTGDDGAPLARRRRIDTRRSIEAMLRRPGEFRWRHRHAPVRPSYLVLIDAEDERDPRGRLFMLWAERLSMQGLAVDIRLVRRSGATSVDGLPATASTPAGSRASAPLTTRASRRPGSTDSGVPLDRLPDPTAGQRLVVIAQARDWLDPDGQWPGWLRRARLHRWRERVFFTPTEMRFWGDAEERIEDRAHSADPGFLVLPLDEGALDAWSRLLVQGSLPMFDLVEPQRFPPLLADAGFDPFTKPPAAQVDRLIAQLILYLGDTGYRWLCGLAIAPLVRWELTLLIGQSLIDAEPGLDAAARQALTARGYRRIARLPWMRGGPDAAGVHRGPALPLWLRTRLLDELPLPLEQALRSRITALLAQVHAGSDGVIELGFEAPPVAGRAPASPALDDGDQLYLGYLSGLTPRQLAQRMPDEWLEWLRERPAPPPGLVPRLADTLRQARAWLGLRAARLAFRGGLPWAGRGRTPWVLALAGWGALGVLAAVDDWPPGRLPVWAEPWLLHTATRPVDPPASSAPVADTLSPDGRFGLLIEAEGRIRLWDTASGRVHRTLTAGRTRLVGGRFDADGRTVFACLADGRVQGWWVADGEPLPGSTRAGGAAAATNGTEPKRYDRCSLGPRADQALWWDKETPPDEGGVYVDGTRNPAAAPVPGHQHLSPDGVWARRGDVLVRLASGDSDRTVLPGAARAQPDAPSAWGGDRYGTVLPVDGVLSLMLFHPATGETFSLAIEASDQARPTALALGHDARYAAIGDAAGRVTLWDLSTRTRLGSRALHPGAVSRLELDAAGETLLSRDAAGPAVLSRLWLPRLAPAQPAAHAALSADGQSLALSRDDGEIRLLGAAASGRNPTLRGPAATTALSISTGGRQLAAAAADGRISRWSLPGPADARVWTPPSPADGGRAGAPAAKVQPPQQRQQQVPDAVVGDPVRLIRHVAKDELVAVTVSGAVVRIAAQSDAEVQVRATGLRIDDTGLAAISTQGQVALVSLAGSQARAALYGADGKLADLALEASRPRTGWRQMELAFGSEGRTLWVLHDGEHWRFDTTTGAALGAHPAVAELQASRGLGTGPIHIDERHQRMVWRDRDGRLVLVDLAGARPLELPEDLRRPQASADWLPDGRLLTVDLVGLGRVWALDTDGRLRATPSAPLAAIPASRQTLVSTDGRRVAVLDGRSAAWWALPAPAEPTRRLASWQPDRLPHPVVWGIGLLLLSAVGAGLRARRDQQELMPLVVPPPRGGGSRGIPV